MAEPARALAQPRARVRPIRAAVLGTGLSVTVRLDSVSAAQSVDLSEGRTFQWTISVKREDADKDGFGEVSVGERCRSITKTSSVGQRRGNQDGG